MQFTRVVNTIEDMEVWNANSDGISFVISYESRSGSGFHGRLGFVASWRPIHQNTNAIKIGGSPFGMLAEAEEACKAMLAILPAAGRMAGNEAHVNFDAPAVLRKWPSFGNQRRTEGPGSPYLLVEGTLEECLREFAAKPASAHHLYEIQASPKPPLRVVALPEGLIIELARLRNLL